MKLKSAISKMLSLFTLLFTVALLTYCSNLSESFIDKSAGLNGSFEMSQNGLPVNWDMYSPATLPDADFNIIVDKEVYKEGKQSLRFDVRDCSAEGDWKSPGFTNEFIETGRFEGEANYKVSFWVINDGSEFNPYLSLVKDL